MAESEDSSASPDSTTKERLGFVHGEDVLLQHKDGKYYLGTIVEVDMAGERCRVKFLDNTSSWSSIKELTKLASESDVTCVLCKKSQPKTENDIVTCDKCGRGYHQFCHLPQIKKEETLPDAHWQCRKCCDSQQPKGTKEIKKSMVKPNIRKLCSGRDQPLPPPDDKTKLPYDPEMLNWDAHHRVNAEQIYCYCGLNGEWYTQMLQCARCKQWFHEKCIGCLTYPLYSGDRFYVFVCSMCNYGKEFVRRLELKWVDLVHLMLYNLTVYNAKKYYDLDTVIVPYANDNWNTLQLPPRIRDVTAQVRKESILAILTNNRNRFKCGREIKKRTTIWGLRVRLPPPCPVVNLPSTGVIDDSVLRRCWGASKRLQFLSPTTEPVALPESTKQLHTLKQSLAESVEIAVNPSDVVMRGTIYQNSEVDQSSSSSPTNQITQTLRESDNEKLTRRYSGGGFVKKSVPFPKLSLQRRRRLMALGSSRERILRKHKKRDMESDEQGSTKLQDMREARIRKARKLVKNAIAKSKSRNAEPSDLPPTPPTSVSGPPTPPATTSSGISEVSVPSSLELQLATPSTPADTSGDETSSRGTLDSFIPPPKDFEGKNNPFRNLSELLGVVTPSSSCSNGSSCSSAQSTFNPSPITLPLPLTPVISQPPIVRPAKRQLSEKDIIIDRNGQVKRRRTHRRGRPPQQQSSSYQQTASKTAAIIPARNSEVKNTEFNRNLRSSFSTPSSDQISNCVDYALNGRRLRQRGPSTDKLLPPQNESSNSSSATLPAVSATVKKSQPCGNCSGSMPNSPTKCSPVKQNAPDISIDDLKSSVNVYFGAANRIASGENFTIKGKRLGPNGCPQYLIEWDSPMA
ncbi:PHD finger protein 19 isoform X2 [Phymastichus coffea]|uniref:PHD finger protein 19 isoform X2 n=1 Tax=Phymastichus coffea TaxID=108790 RepID=UPI00273B11C8|nr:PHD finger protein 19 isoform X2 [Phymastichus coffea]